MKREDGLIEEITAYPNMHNAVKMVLRGTKRKRCRVGRVLLQDIDKTINRLSGRIRDGTFRLSDYREYLIKDGPKERVVQSVSLENRIVLNAVMNVVDERLKKRFIRTTAASIKNRGIHDLQAYMVRDMRDDPEGTAYCYKFDIRKFYESVNQDLMKKVVRRYFKEPLLLDILDKSISMMPKGMSIGLRSSQGLCNLILSDYLDHVLKDKLGVKYYYRYCDDGVILSDSKRYLWSIRDVVHNRASAALLEIKNDDRIFPVSEGVDFLGYVTTHDKVLLRKRNKKSFARKIKQVKSLKRKQELTASFYGMTKHADCCNLFKKLTGLTMRDFKSMGIGYVPSDGKKRFKGNIVSIRELVNMEVTVVDCEMGVRTKEGDDRCIVAVERDGTPCKFFTNSEEMKSILMQISELSDGFPFKTTIKAEMFGKGKTKYIFT